MANLGVLIESTPILIRGDQPVSSRRYPGKVFYRPAMALVAFAATMVLIRHGGFFTSRPWSGTLDGVAVLLAAGSALPLVVWRRHPLAVFVVTSASAIALAGFGYPADVLAGPAIALFLLAGAGTSRRAMVVAGAMFAAYLLAAGLARQGFPSSELLHNGLAWGVAWFAGERTRLRREQLAALHARAERAELEADMQRQLAVAEERARIARDLHDSAGHAINVIAVRAGAARLRQDAERSVAALRDIENLARQTAAQIDQIVGGLRAREETILVPLGVASLGTLVAQHNAAGFSVSLDVEGDSATQGSPGDQAIFRCVQEALTNAVKYGTGSAEVVLSFHDGWAEVTVTNPVQGDDDDSGACGRNGGGHGLIGMRERLGLLGGTLQTGWSDGTFELQARIPMAGQAL